MRLYLKLTAFVLVFLVLSGLSGEAAGDRLYEVGFAARCLMATVRQDATMEESLVKEFQEHLRMLTARDVAAAVVTTAATVASPGATTRPTTRALVDW